MDNNDNSNNPFIINITKREVAEQAREQARQITLEALRLARQCKGDKVEKAVRTAASQLGQKAAELRKQAKQAAQEAAEARRVACYKALPPKEAPKPFVLPLKPPPQNHKDDHDYADVLGLKV